MNEEIIEYIGLPPKICSIFNKKTIKKSNLIVFLNLLITLVLTFSYHLEKRS